MTQASSSPAGRTGRNLPLATAVGLGLFAIFGLSIWFKTVVFVILVTAVILIAVAEVIRALAPDISSNAKEVLLASVPFLNYFAYTGGIDALFVAVLITIAVILVVALRGGHQGYLVSVSKSIFILIYVPLFASFAVLLAGQPEGRNKVIALVLLTIGSDIGGYFVGSFFGKHQLAPNISPKKSWEGLVGSIVLQAILGLAIWHYLFTESWWKGAIVGAIMAVTATIGDLIESMIKRDAGIKDMSQLVPGHGGVMDRIDSLLFNAVVAWLLFSLFV
ncbi:MAG: phosphatidate cytidylyltransferase [Actinomycetales bacterium]|nr:phosphatidate cytidylyltransferase [Actinomycetales bacterium]